MRSLNLVVLAHTDGLKVTTSLLDAGTGWPEMGEEIDQDDLLRCARLASAQGAVLTLTVIGDGMSAYNYAQSEPIGGAA